MDEGLVVDGLRRSFGDVVALDGVSFRVAPGTIHGFVGANGAGKTTTMRIVVGVERADAGTATLDGRPVAPQRRRVGYLPEERGLYPDMQVRDQLVHLGRLHGMPAGAARDAADAYLERLGLTERASDKAADLSLGNQQRVQLAAALLHEPALLLLDEPFSGLDPVAADVMAEILLEQAGRGVPVLFSSHQLELVERLCDHVTIIAAGRQVADGTIGELRRQRRERRFRVEVAGGAPALDDVAGVRDCRVDGDVAVLLLDEHADEQLVLDAARDAGRVVAFAPVVPSLAELYREVTVPHDGVGGDGADGGRAGDGTRDGTGGPA